MFKMNGNEETNEQQENESSSLAQFAHSNDGPQMGDPSVGMPAANQMQAHAQTASAYNA